MAEHEHTCAEVSHPGHTMCRCSCGATRPYSGDLPWTASDAEVLYPEAALHRHGMDDAVLYGDPVFVLALIVHSVPHLEDASMEHGIGGPTYADLLFPGGHRHRITIERLPE